jgi:hypothetical protein
MVYQTYSGDYYKNVRRTLQVDLFKVYREPVKQHLGLPIKTNDIATLFSDL